MSKPGTSRKPKAKTESAGKASDTFDWSAFDAMDDAFWKRAKLVMPMPKQAISIRLDTDVLEFFKDEGPGYQSRINAVLRSYMDAKK